MNLALFDFDGTVTVTDTFLKFLRFAVPPSRVIFGSVLLSPVGIGYTLGRIPGTKARPLYARVAFQGRSAEAVRALGRMYAIDVVPGMLRPRAMDRIAWHKQQGDAIVIVSASLDVYLRPWCKAQGVDLICSELEERNGVFTGQYVEGDCSGAEKAARIVRRYRTEHYSTIYAYGDSSDDREMLDLAHRRYYRGREIADWRSGLRDADLNGHGRRGV